MLLAEIIKPDSVLCHAHARSKKHCLEILSELLVRSNPDISADEIFENLIERAVVLGKLNSQQVGLDQRVVQLMRITCMIAEHFQYDINRMAQLLLVAFEAAIRFIAVHDIFFLLFMRRDFRYCRS